MAVEPYVFTYQHCLVLRGRYFDFEGYNVWYWLSYKIKWLSWRFNDIHKEIHAKNKETLIYRHGRSAIVRIPGLQSHLTHTGSMVTSEISILRTKDIHKFKISTYGIVAWLLAFRIMRTILKMRIQFVFDKDLACADAHKNITWYDFLNLHVEKNNIAEPR